MADILKMTFKLSDTQTHTLSLKDPKAGATKAEVEAVMNDIITKQALIAKGVPMKGIKTAYIQRVQDIELA